MRHGQIVTRVLLTNDDGVTEGLAALARVLEPEFEVFTVAPAGPYANIGTATGSCYSPSALPEHTPRSSLATARVVDEPPARIVELALDAEFGPAPDLVLSGINYGPNIGLGALHSGTLGAALTAGFRGVPAIAISLDDEWPDRGRIEIAPDQLRWDTAAEIGARAAIWMMGEPECRVLSINVPSMAPAELRGVGASCLDRAVQSLPQVDAAGPDDVALLERRIVSVSAVPTLADLPTESLFDTARRAAAAVAATWPWPLAGHPAR